MSAKVLDSFEFLKYLEYMYNFPSTIDHDSYSPLFAHQNAQIWDLTVFCLINSLQCTEVHFASFLSG